jgi:3-oxoacyl-[acyl-carrier protein] reductase
MNRDFRGTRAVNQYRLVETGTLDRIATVDEVARVVDINPPCFQY